MATVRALTFDLWDTLIVDGSDEPARRAAGLPARADARLEILADWLGGDLGPAALARAWEDAAASCRRDWLEGSRTPPLPERLERVAAALGRSPPAGIERAARRLGDLEAEVPPRPAPGAAEALERLTRRYRLAIVSDAIVTPGASLRRILAHWGLLRHVRATIFSDEVGVSKPHLAVFEAACTALDVPRGPEVVHVGDREETDVHGARAAGLGAILYVGVRDRRRAGRTAADAVCRHLRDLPALLEDWPP